jgi:rod shape-determining protein MreD
MKIANKILHFLLLIAALIIQITFFEHLKMYNIFFDLVLIILVAVTLIDGAFYGIVFGFIIGLLLDLVAGDLIGISALIYALDGFIVSRLMEAGLKFRLTSQVILMFAVTETNLIAASLIRYLFNFDISLSTMGMELLLRPVFNIILLVILYPAIRISLRQRVESFEFKYKDKT